MANYISLHCPGCKAPVHALPEMRGRKVRCPKCKHIFIFEWPDEATIDVPVVEEVAKERPRKPRRGGAVKSP